MTKTIAKAYYTEYGDPRVRRMNGLDYKVKYTTTSKKVAERESEIYHKLGCKTRILTSQRNKKVLLVYVNCGRKPSDEDL